MYMYNTKSIFDDIYDAINSKIETHYLLIVDASGSMSTLVNETVSGINKQIDTIKKLDNDDNSIQSYYLTLVLFDSSIRKIYDSVHISEVNHITEEDYNVGGMTALLDAMGESITDLNNKLGERIKDNSVSGVVVVITD